MVFQDYALFPHLTVAQNVAFGLHRLSPATRLRRAEDMLATVGLGDYRDPSIRISSPAASSSALRWRARWHPSLNWCCSMSRSPAWTSSYVSA